MKRKSIHNLIKKQLDTKICFLQIITKELYVVAEILDDILRDYTKEIIHYDILQGFDVPTKETVQQQFSKTVDKWLSEKTFNDTALVISGSDNIFENETVVLAIRKMVCEESKRICSKPKIVVIISDSDCLPLQLKDIATILHAPLMDLEECKTAVKDVLRVSKKENDYITRVARELLGLTQSQVEICLRETESDNEDKFIERIKDKKASFLNQSGLITIEHDCIICI